MNIEKYSKFAIGHLFAHYERRVVEDSQTGEKSYVRFGNREIDSRYTPLNYRTWPPLEDATDRGIWVSEDLQAAWDDTGDDPDEAPLERWRRRWRTVPHSKRKDLVALVGVVFTLPDPIPLDRADEFFDLVTRFIVDRYGADNMMGAWVHWDESGRPHLHAAVTPVCQVQRKGGETVETFSAKTLLNRRHYRTWHTDADAYISAAMKITNTGIINGVTARQGGNRSVAQMKREQRDFLKGRGGEIAKARGARLRAMQRRKAPLENALVGADRRREMQLQPQRKPTLSERLRGL